MKTPPLQQTAVPDAAAQPTKSAAKLTHPHARGQPHAAAGEMGQAASKPGNDQLEPEEQAPEEREVEDAAYAAAAQHGEVGELLTLLTCQPRQAGRWPWHGS